MSTDGKQTLMQAGEALFAAKGYSATSVRDICGQANVTQPSLYHFFGSKENLLIELIDQRYGDYTISLEETLNNQQTPLEVCQAYVEFISSRITKSPVTAKFVFSIMFGPQQDIPKDSVTAHLSESRNLFTRHLKRVAPDVPDRRLIFASVSMHGMITPVVLQFLVYGTVDFPADMADCFAQRITAILTDELPVCKWPDF